MSSKYTRKAEFIAELMPQVMAKHRCSEITHWSPRVEAWTDWMEATSWSDYMLRSRPEHAVN